MKAAGPVVEHKTYVAAHCTRCKAVAMRVCIVHDDCEYDHDARECDSVYRVLILDARRVLEHLGNLGPDFREVLQAAIDVNERIKGRE
jgi:hypothetical protein